jgi:hypothetical protein
MQTFPENPKSHTVVVDTNHLNTPSEAFKQIEKWLRAL